jgi:alcohol dehydrogenase
MTTPGSSPPHSTPEPLDHWEGEVAGTRVLAGPGVLADLGAIAAGSGARGVLLVGDRGVAEAGHVRRAADSLEAAGLAVEVFTDAESQPTSDGVERAARRLADGSRDLIVAVGGGSVLDTAKALNLLLAGGGRIEDYWGSGRGRGPLLPTIGVPATAGTGSEAQSYAVISRSTDGRRMACGDRRARFHTALLDPEVVATAPAPVAAAAGLDAMSHALESWVSLRRSPVSSLYAREAWRLLSDHLARYLADPGDRRHAAAALLAAHLAGAAIEQSMLGAAHAAANPLSARHGVVHGAAVALTLPAVVRWNAAAVGPLYEDLDPEGAEALARRVEALRLAVGLPGSLEEVGVPPAAIPELARLACEEWTGTFNPRAMSDRDFEEIYHRIHAAEV